MMKARIALLVVSLLIGFQSTRAHASANLKQVQVSEKNQIEVLFDSKVREDQIQVEYIRDIIQVTLSDVNVYPARVSNMSGGDLKKVFAYQYSPKTVRCRLSVEGNAEDYKNRFKLKLSGKTLSMKIIGAKSSAASKTASAQTTRDTGLIAEKEEKTPEPHLSEGEKALLDKVMKQPAQQDKDKTDPKKIKTKKAKGEDLEISAEESRVPSPLRTFGMLGIVIALFAVTAFAVKKWRDRSGASASSNSVPRGLKGMITQALSQKLGKNKKLIEIVANHYLGPKKSISVVKIQGRTLVLGVSQDSINLIAQLPNDASADDIDLESFAQSSAPANAMSSSSAFSQMLTSASVNPKSEPKITLGASTNSYATAASIDSTSAPTAQPQKPRNSIRDRIRKEVENLKSV